MGALRSLADDGLVRMVGISNASVPQIDAARAIVGDALVSVQNQFSPGYRSSAAELAHCAARGARLAAVEPLRRGVGGRVARREAPAFAEVAEELGVSVYQVTWRGTSRRPTSSCRSRARPGRRRSSTPPRPPTSSSPPTTSPASTPADPAPAELIIVVARRTAAGTPSARPQVLRPPSTGARRVHRWHGEGPVGVGAPDRRA